MAGANRCARRRTCRSSTLSTTNPTRTFQYQRRFSAVMNRCLSHGFSKLAALHCCGNKYSIKHRCNVTLSSLHELQIHFLVSSHYSVLERRYSAHTKGTMQDWVSTLMTVWLSESSSLNMCVCVCVCVCSW